MKIATVQPHAGPDKQENVARGMGNIDAKRLFLRNRRAELYAAWIR